PTCRARRSCTRRRAAPVRTAVRRCASSARTSPRCSISYRVTSRVLRHVRPKFSCGHCARVIQLPAPSRPIDRGLPAPGLLAQVITAKYADHCPLYRQQAIYRRSGVDLDRATLADWVGGTSELLELLVGPLGRYARAAA